MPPGIKTLEAEVVAGIRVLVSDLWRPYPAVRREGRRFKDTVEYDSKLGGEGTSTARGEEKSTMTHTGSRARRLDTPVAITVHWPWYRSTALARAVLMMTFLGLNQTRFTLQGTLP